MKRLMLLAAAAAIVGFTGPVSAQGNSEPGLDRYNNNPGFQRASENQPPPCDPAYSGAGAQGAFGFFGKGNPGGFPKPSGNTGQEHGAAMAAVCGNKDGTKHPD